MKFILAEPRHTLNEKFVLNEAPVLRTNLELINDYIDNATKKIVLCADDLRKDKTDYAANAKAIEDVAKQLLKALIDDDPAAVKEYSTRYLTSIDALRGNSVPLKTSVNKLKGLLNGRVTKATIPDITKNIQDLQKEIENAQTGKLRTNNTVAEQAKVALQDAADNLKEVKKYAKYLASEDNLVLATKKGLELLNKLPSERDLDQERINKRKAYEADCGLIIETCSAFIGSELMGIINHKKIDSQVEDQKNQKKQDDLDALAKEQSATGINWAKRFTEVTGIKERKALWYNYYSTVWKDNADIVKKLGYAFQDELKQYGFEEYSNPFITFVKLIIKKGLDIDATKYDAIDTAYHNGLINKNDLTGEGELGGVNIIFSQDLYNYTTDVIADYLKKQKDARTAYSKGFQNSVLNAKYGSTADENKIKVFMLDLMYTPGNTIVADETRTEGNLKMKLKALRTIDHEIKVCFPTLTKTDSTKKAEEVDFEKIVRNLGSKTDYINFIKFLIITYGADSVEQQELFTKYRDLSGKDMPSWQTMVTFRKLVGDNVKIKSSDLTKLVKKLAEKGGLN